MHISSHKLLTQSLIVLDPKTPARSVPGSWHQTQAAQIDFLETESIHLPSIYRHFISSAPIAKDHSE